MRNLLSALICVLFGLPFGASFGASADAGASVRVWVSSLDLQDKLTEKASIPFVQKAKKKLAEIAVDPSTTCQSILGIGSSFEHATCYNLSLLPTATREKVIDSLVNPETGIGMSLMRVCIGTSDFVGEPWYSYDDMPAGQTDPDLKHFSIEKDQTYVLPVLKSALQKNPNLIFFASPWSPPAWMKDSVNMCGGRLLPEYWNVYAQYFVKFLQAYEAEGIPIYAVTIQNEPGVNVPTYPSCFWNGDMQRDFVKQAMGPVFRDKGIRTEVWCFDHNFNNTRFPRAILSDSGAAQYVQGTAFHHYEGKPESMGDFAKEFPEKPVYFTEGSVYRLRGAMQIIQILTNGARSYNAWVTVIDEKGKPNNGPHNCSPTCIVFNSQTHELEYRFDYYMYGHFSKFLRPGAIRLGSTPGDSQFANIAVRNADGTLALVVVNNGSLVKSFKVSCGGKVFQTELAARTMATYTWRP